MRRHATPASAADTPAPAGPRPSKIASLGARLRQILLRPGLDFMLEAHDGPSARSAEDAGFSSIWASGQSLEVLECMADAARLPILVDGGSGQANADQVRRLVRNLEQTRLAGICLGDKLRANPDTNGQRLADIDEVCGRLRAAKDARLDDAFVVVARTDAFLAGVGLEETLRRAEAYRAAGADAILVHSTLRHPEEVLAFQRQWAGRSPVVIAPTSYHATPASVFRTAGFSLAIWAERLLPTALWAMQQSAPRPALR